MAPSLRGIVGAKPGSTNWPKASSALKTANIVWTPATLDLYLTAPAVLVPGTTMPIKVPSATDRANLIAYLDSAQR